MVRVYAPIVSALLGLAPASLSAQDATGRILGTVSDAQNAMVPQAKVTVVNTATGQSRTTLSDANGDFQVVSLPIGSYTVAAEKNGFRKSISSPQQLLINASLRIDVKLEVGAMTEVVQVEETSSAVEVVNATLGSSITSDQIINAPLNGRNVLDLALFLPGVIPTGAQTGGSGAGAGSFSVAGGRQDSVTYLLDGGMNNNLLSNGVVYTPNPDTVAEFKILTSNYSAEYGRNGGGIVSMVTKSGTSSFHGTVYDYLRNDAFNANKFFNNANGLPKEVLKRNQFGGTLGGPVILPKILTGRDKLFFFFGYQGQRQTSLSTTSAVTTFTPAELGGDFSKSSNGGPDPDVVGFLQQNPYFQSNPTLASQGIIDPNRIDAVAKNYVKAGLIPSSASGTAIFQGAAKSDADEYTGKVDYQVTANDRISLTLGYQDLPSKIPFYYSNTPGFPVTSEVKRSYGNLGYTRTFSTTLLNDFRFTAQRNNNLQLVPAGKAPTGPQLGVGITPDHATGPTLIELYGVGTTMGFSPNGPTALIDNTYNFSDTLTWIKGRHTLKAGGWYTPYQNNTVYDYYVNGDFFFYGPGSTFLNNDKAAFIMGLPDEYLQFPEAPSNIRTHNMGFFWQDEWRVNSRLTLNYGVRYEYSSPKYDTQRRSFSLKFGQQSTVFPDAPLGELFPGDPGAPRGSNFPDKNDFAPRLGIAYDPAGNGKMSIRAGFGVFYDILKAEDNLQFNGQAPFFGFADLYFNPLDPTSSSAPGIMSDPYGAAGAVNPFPSKPPAKNINFDDSGFLPVGGGGVYFVNPHLRTPYVYQYNLSIERDLGWGNILDLAYVGSDSHKLTGLYDANPFVLGTNTRLFNTQPGVPSYGFSYLDTFDNIGKAHYNSLEVGLKRRGGQIKNFGSLFYQVSYTYGRSMDNSSGFRARNSQVPYYNHAQFYGPSDYDIEHYVSVNGAWELPFAEWFSKAPRALTKGWTLYPVLSYRSGLPIDVWAGLTTSRKDPGTSGAGDAGISRANLVGPMTFYDPKKLTTLNGATGNFYFDPASFSNAEFLDPNFDPVDNASQRTYGSLGRNAFRGPTRTNINVTLAKITPLWGERLKSEFRADFFNVLNHAQFDNPNNSIASPLFGTVSTTADPRIIQLALRLSF